MKRLVIGGLGRTPSMSERVQRNAWAIVWAAASGREVVIAYGSEDERVATAAGLAAFADRIGGA